MSVPVRAWGCVARDASAAIVGALLALCATGTARADDAVAPVKICVGAFTAEGLPAEAEAALKQALVAELSGQGADVLSKPSENPLEESCFATPRCLRRAVTTLGVAGVLDVRAVRLGPMVRVAIRTFDAASGKQVAETATMASAKGFPARLELGEDLQSSLSALRALRPPPPPPIVATPVETAPPAVAPAAPEPPATVATVATPVDEPARPEEQTDSFFSPLRIGGLVTATTGGLLLASGLGLIGYEALVLSKQIEREHTTTTNADGESVTIVTDPDGYRAQADLAQLLWGGGWLVAGVGAAAGITGVALLLLGGEEGEAAP